MKKIRNILSYRMYNNIEEEEEQEEKIEMVEMPEEPIICEFDSVLTDDDSDYDEIDVGYGTQEYGGGEYIDRNNIESFTNDNNEILDLEYDDIPLDFILIKSYKSEDLKKIFDYKEKDALQNKSLLSKLSNEYYNLMKEYSLRDSWKSLILFYWIGFTNNVIHKREFLKYHEDLARLIEKLDYLHKKLDKYKEEFANKNDDKEETFNNENQVISELESIYTVLNKVLIDHVVFMCHSKAPIGDFFNLYKKVKSDVLLYTPVKQNFYYINTLCGIEIRNSQLKRNKYFDIKNYYKYIQNNDDVKSEQIVEFQQIFENEIKEDEIYIRKEYFLDSFNYYVNTLRSHLRMFEPNTTPEKEKYSIIRYRSRQDAYNNIIEKLFVLNKLCKQFEMDNKEEDKEKIKNYGRYISSDFKTLNTLITEENDKFCPDNYDRLLHIVTGDLVYEPNSDKDIWDQDIFSTFLSRKWFWKEYNIRIINDILKVKDMLIEQYDLNEIKEILNNLSNIIEKMLKIEKDFEITVINQKQETLNQNDSMYKKYKYMDEPLSKVYNNKELWWFYFKYPQYIEEDNSYYIDAYYPWVRMGFPKENKYHKDNAIRDFSILHNYRKPRKGKSFRGNKDTQYLRPKLPIDINFNWEEMEQNIDRIEYSKRQQKYITYLYNQNILPYDFRELNTNLIKIEMLIESVRKTQDIFNQLDKMGEFIKYGVLINDQLFFKFILFGINILTFIGQYFWTNHIEPEIYN